MTIVHSCRSGRALRRNVEHDGRETDVERRCAQTSRMTQGGMQIGPDQAAFLALLVRATGVQRALEIGTFTGYSALAVAKALPEGGRLLLLRRQRRMDAGRAPLLARRGRRRKDRARLAPAAKDTGGPRTRSGTWKLRLPRSSTPQRGLRR